MYVYFGIYGYLCPQLKFIVKYGVKFCENFIGKVGKSLL